MQSLILKGSKYSFFLLLLLTLPVLLQTEQILSLWLGQLPDKVIIFSQLSLVDSLVISLSGTLIAGAQANGNIKIYQIVTGGVLLLNLPLSYLMFLYGAKPEAAMALMVVISIIALSIRLLFMRKMIGLSIRAYCRVVLSRVFLVALFSCLIMWYLDSFMGSTFLYLIVESFTSIFVVISTIWLLGLEYAERRFVLNKLSAFYSKLKVKSSP
jgi:hypothetical protein